MSEFEPIGIDVAWEGKLIQVGIERFRHSDGAEVAREKVWHPGAVGILAIDADNVWLTTPAPRSGRRAGIARDPGWQARRGRGVTARGRGQRARRGDRQARGQLGRG